jgi:hypothetical protein
MVLERNPGEATTDEYRFVVAASHGELLDSASEDLGTGYRVLRFYREQALLLHSHRPGDAPDSGVVR